VLSARRFQPHYDVMIIGARCAGAATALLLARSGAKVLLVDRQPYGTDTLSTHALMRGGVFQLMQWGLLPEISQAGTPSITATTFHYGRDELRIAIKPEHGVGSLYAPRRTVLDRVLVDAARRAGADVWHGVALSDLRFAQSGRVTGAELTDAQGIPVEVRVDITVGADGRQSSVARLVNARQCLEGRNASGCVFGYFKGLKLDGLHWYFAEGAAAGVIPTNGGHCIFAAVPASRFHAAFGGDTMLGFRQALQANSLELRAAIDGAALQGRLRRFAGAASFLREAHGPGWALVGDAGYYKDPLTAHGITDALRDADLLSRAIIEGHSSSLVTYQDQRDALSLPFFGITDAIAGFSWNMTQIKAHHTQLSAAMKAEFKYLASLGRPAAQAA
jgi:flavin-dependent dehydrogenase